MTYTSAASRAYHTQEKERGGEESTTESSCPHARYAAPIFWRRLGASMPSFVPLPIRVYVYVYVYVHVLLLL